MKNNLTWAFFGTSMFSVIILEKLKEKGFVPTIIVTMEDKPKGRNLVMTPPETKVWAEREGIPYLQLKTLRKPESEDLIKSYSDLGFDLFIVASYGKIIPDNILEIPKHKTLNVHPSLLPKLRGPSPIQSAILKESETGVTIMRVDTNMDHGPIVAQKKVEIDWPPYADELEKVTAEVGAEMLISIIPDWIIGKVPEIPQDDNEATVCEKIEKSNAEINLEDNAENNLRKIRAYNVWPGAYFFRNEKRIIVKRASIAAGELVLERVVPEGKKEMSYKDFLNGEKSKLV